MPNDKSGRVQAPMRKKQKNLSLYLMLIPATVVLIVFAYIPLVGIKIAFEDFVPAKGLFGKQEFIGLDNFRYAFSLPNFGHVVLNTVFIAGVKLILGLVFPIAATLLLNELPLNRYRKTVQTIIYLPHFISWVVLAGIFNDMLSPTTGVFNRCLEMIGLEPVYFLGNKKVFPWVMIFTDCWKELGFSTIVYLAAIAGIDPQLYEAARMDGASRWKVMWHITLPGIASIIVLMALLSIGNIFNAGFDQIYNMYSPQVYETGDVLDTLIYRLGLMEAQYGVSAAVGLMKSAITAALIGIFYFIAYKVVDYRIF